MLFYVFFIMPPPIFFFFLFAPRSLSFEHIHFHSICVLRIVFNYNFFYFPFFKCQGRKKIQIGFLPDEIAHILPILSSFLWPLNFCLQCVLKLTVPWLTEAWWAIIIIRMMKYYNQSIKCSSWLQYDYSRTEHNKYYILLWKLHFKICHVWLFILWAGAHIVENYKIMLEAADVFFH